MAERTWTTEQRQCIEARGGTLLVSAAAGSGKTAVLVERILHRILGTEDGTPVDIDRMLVVTFTRAAAAEMKQRLNEALTKAAGADPSPHIRRQQLLLPFAHIGTIDSFCAWLVREHAEHLGVSPDFKMMDAAPADLLWQAALTEELEQRYAAHDPDFIRLADSISNGRDDQPLIEAANSLNTFLQSLPFPEEWMAQQLDMFRDSVPMEQTVWGRSRRQGAEEQCRTARELLDRLSDLLTRDPEMDAKYRGVVETDTASLDACLEVLKSPDLSWTELRQAIDAVSYKKLPNRSKQETEHPLPLFCMFQHLRTRFKDSVSAAKKTAAVDPGCFDADRSETAALLSALFEFVSAAHERYRQKKEQARSLDFSDVERLALRLLVTREGGAFARSELAVALHEQFEEIFVDEYQDVNELQNALFSALSREDANLFLVGDVKQSIYGFRKARPELFLDRLHSFSPFDGETYPARILLKENFRSRPQVTDAVNFICSQLFSPDVGGLTYGEDEALTPHRDGDASNGCETTLLVIDQEAILGSDNGEAEADESAPRTVYETEAAVIAREIRALVDSGREIPQKDGSVRPVRYGDFCILLRSFHKHAPVFEACLSRMGVPAYAAGIGDFFAASEIRLAMSLLQVIDNPMRDVPLLAVLLSPLYGFTPDELALIRLQDRRRHLYTVLKKFALTEGELSSRCAAFLREMETYRLLSATVPVDRLLRQIYETTDILHRMAVREDGAQRVANLHLFYDQAHSFEENGFRGLSAFLRHLNRLKTHEKSKTAAVGDQRGAVQIMSVHGSKGLEFPIVFAAGLVTQFNDKTGYSSMLMHADAGIGLKIIDPDTLVKRKPIFYAYVKDRLLRDERSEELRVLYVAMTRAREKLYLVTSLKTPQKSLLEIAANVCQTARPLSPSVVLQGKSFGDWILSAAMRHPDAALLRECAGVPEDYPLLPAAFPWTVRWINAVSVARTPDELPDETPQPDAALLTELTERFSYEYPYRALGSVPSKVAASDLAHREMSRAYVAAARPAILNRTELTAAERGTALHTFLQYADWTAAARDPGQERERLVERGFLTRGQANAVDLRRVRAFFDSELYHRIEKSRQLWREIPFTIEVPLTGLALSTADELASLPPDSKDETMLIQGIADCVFEEDGELVIVDYKTDRVDSGAELTERYHTQLQLYALALRQTLGLPVRECLLYSFALGEVIPVTAPNAEGSLV